MDEGNWCAVIDVETRKLSIHHISEIFAQDRNNEWVQAEAKHLKECNRGHGSSLRRIDELGQARALVIDVIGESKQQVYEHLRKTGAVRVKKPLRRSDSKAVVPASHLKFSERSLGKKKKKQQSIEIVKQKAMASIIQRQKLNLGDTKNCTDNSQSSIIQTLESSSNVSASTNFDNNRTMKRHSTPTSPHMSTAEKVAKYQDNQPGTEAASDHVDYDDTRNCTNNSQSSITEKLKSSSNVSASAIKGHSTPTSPHMSTAEKVAKYQDNQPGTEAALDHVDYDDTRNCTNNSQSSITEKLKASSNVSASAMKGHSTPTSPHMSTAEKLEKYRYKQPGTKAASNQVDYDDTKNRTSNSQSSITQKLKSSSNVSASTNSDNNRTMKIHSTPIGPHMSTAEKVAKYQDNQPGTEAASDHVDYDDASDCTNISQSSITEKFKSSSNVSTNFDNNRAMKAHSTPIRPHMSTAEKKKLKKSRHNRTRTGTALHQNSQSEKENVIPYENTKKIRKRHELSDKSKTEERTDSEDSVATPECDGDNCRFYKKLMELKRSLSDFDQVKKEPEIPYERVDASKVLVTEYFKPEVRKLLQIIRAKSSKMRLNKIIEAYWERDVRVSYNTSMRDTS